MDVGESTGSPKEISSGRRILRTLTVRFFIPVLTLTPSSVGLAPPIPWVRGDLDDLSTRVSRTGDDPVDIISSGYSNSAMTLRVKSRSLPVKFRLNFCFGSAFGMRHGRVGRKKGKKGYFDLLHCIHQRRISQDLVVWLQGISSAITVDHRLYL